MGEKILIVDDDLDTLRLVGQMLESQGYQILAASNGTQALSKARADLPDLVLLDIMMPDVDGIEVIRQLRSDSRVRHLPVILFTAKTQLDEKITGFEAGADDYLTKPVHPRELIARVRAVLSRAQKGGSSAGPARQGWVVGLMAAKGGVGASTVAVNLATLLGQHLSGGVIAAELRPGNGSWGIDLGYLKTAGLMGYTQFAPEDITAELVEKDLVQGLPGVRLLMAASQPAEIEAGKYEAQMAAVLRQLAHLAPLVVAELGVNLFPCPDPLLECCDEVLLVLDGQPGTVARIKALIDDLAHKGFGKAKPVGVVLNQRSRSEAQLSWSQVQDELGQPLAAVLVPTPELAFQAAARCLPMLLLEGGAQNVNAQQFTRLAEAVIARAQPA